MTIAIDTSVMVAAIVGSEAHHAECDRLLDSGLVRLYSHGLSEAFSTLTGGRKSFRVSADVAVEMIESDYLPSLEITTLTPGEMLRALRESEARGVRGGAVFDYLHLVAARKAKATKFYTLNVSDYRSFHRAGDPDIVHP